MTEPARVAPVDLPPEVDPAVGVDLGNEEARTRWAVDSPGRAAYAMARLRDAGSELARLTVERDEAHARVDAWFERRSAGSRDTVEYMTGQLAAYGLAQREATGNATTEVIGGRVETRRTAEAIKVTDPDTALAWARTEAPDLVEHVVPDPYDKLPYAKVKAAAHIRDVETCSACGDRVTRDEGGTPWCPECGTTPPDIRLVRRAQLRHEDPETGEVTYSDPIPGVEVKPETITPTVRPDQR